MVHGVSIIYHTVNATDNPMSRSIITYVLLCGYSPFRAEETREMVRETTEARIEFHERYWSKVSDEGGVSHVL